VVFLLVHVVHGDVCECESCRVWIGLEGFVEELWVLGDIAVWFTCCDWGASCGVFVECILGWVCVTFVCQEFEEEEEKSHEHGWSETVLIFLFLVLVLGGRRFGLVVFGGVYIEYYASDRQHSTELN